MIKRILELRENVKVLDELYESNNETLLNGKYISDSEYDEMYLELVDLELEHPEYFDENSPTQKIVTEVVDELSKVEHSTPMLSQEKIIDNEGILKFVNRSNSSVLIQDKLDGLTILAVYENGRLTQAVTRGNGYVGEDVIHNVRTFKNVPKIIPFKGRLEVRLEALVPYKEFERININGRYSNPRNLASGTVRQLDSNVTKERNLIAIAFDLISAEDKSFNTDTEMLSFLSDQGFEVVNFAEFNNSESGITKMLDFVSSYEDTIRTKLPYMVDGLVLKFNELSVRETLGSTSKYPKWAIAYKFKSVEASTKLLSITHQVGKTGQITPVAELETVEIDDVNISRATLHNYSIINSKDIRIGDQVVVIRANDVIPQVVKPLIELRNGNEEKIETPSHCPACGSITELDGENIFCTGVDCAPQLQRKVEHFASRDAMNIDGLGKKTIELFFANDIITSFTDVYRLHEKKDIICGLDGFGEKSYQRIVSSVEESKSNPLNKVIYALSIKHIGRSASRDLANHFKSMDAIIENSKDVDTFRREIGKINAFGEVMTNCVVDFFSNDINIDVINELISFDLTMKSEEIAVEGNRDSSISGKVFVVTGKVEHFKNRNEIKAKIESLGGKVTGSVSGNTDYLLNNDINSNSSKNKKAKELNIPIISEEELINMI